MRKVLITGVTGQDGSYIAESYLQDKWEVHGLVRRSSTLTRPRIDHLYEPGKSQDSQALKLHYGDLNDGSALIRVVSQVEPEVVINLAAQSHVAVSFDVPLETGFVTGLGAASLFEAIRIVNPKIRLYQAGSSEMFGGMLGRQKLDESSFFAPKSPYAVAKVYAHWMAKTYRDSYDMYISNGILFNHESPRRGENFVSRKISLSVARIHLGLQKSIRLGNIHATRDWGHAKEYVRAIRMIVDADKPDDYVVATGTSFSVEDFAREAFACVGLVHSDFLEIDPILFRPNDVQDLIGDPSKIQKHLGWSHSVDFTDLVREMVESDIALLKRSPQ